MSAGGINGGAGTEDLDAGSSNCSLGGDPYRLNDPQGVGFSSSAVWLLTSIGFPRGGGHGWRLACSPCRHPWCCTRDRPDEGSGLLELSPEARHQQVVAAVSFSLVAAMSGFVWRCVSRRPGLGGLGVALHGHLG